MHTQRNLFISVFGIFTTLILNNKLKRESFALFTSAFSVIYWIAWIAVGNRKAALSFIKR